MEFFKRNKAPKAESYEEPEKVQQLVAELDSTPADENSLLDWMHEYFKTNGEVAHANAKEQILRSFEEKGYRPFVEGDPAASEESPRTTIEQSLTGIKDTGVIPQFFDAKYRRHRGQ